MIRFRHVRIAVGLLVAIGGLSRTAVAQTNDEIFPSLQWNFSTPGARASGMGRTFIGKADDASAAVTNPAGLLNLTRPQIYAEFRNTKLSVDRLSTADSLTTRQPTTTTRDINALSFASVSAPVGSRLAVAASVHRFLDYHETVSLAARPVPNGSSTFFPVNGFADFTGTSVGGSVAFRVTQELRLGVTIGGAWLQADSVATRTGTGISNPTNIIINETSIHDSQVGMSATFGALYRVPSDKVSVGFSYVKSPSFNTTENLQTNPGVSATPQTNQTLVTAADFPKAVEINVPDHFGFGVAVRPSPKLLVSADVVRAMYSSLSKNTTIIFNPSSGSVGPTEYSTPDVTELHLGAEYNAYSMKGNTLLLRGGVFTNPSHRVSYTTGTVATEIAKYNLLPRKDDTRGTVGGGIVIGRHSQVDVAYIFGGDFVASTAVRF